MQEEVKCVPKFEEGNLMYIREEKEGHYLIKSNVRGDLGPFVANKSAMEIIRLCNGSQPLNQIYLEFASKNAAVPLDVIKEDVDKTLKELHLLGLISWSGDNNPFSPRRREGDFVSLANGYTLFAYQEEDINKLETFLKNYNLPCFKEEIQEREGSLVYIFPFCSGVEFNKLVIRAKTFQCYETYFLASYEERITGVVGIRGSLPAPAKDIEMPKIATVSLLIFESKSEKDVNAKLLEFALSRFKNYLVSEVPLKVRLFLPDSQTPKYQYLRDLIEGIGFSKECSLSNEINRGESLSYYAKSDYALCFQEEI
ncbi:MAG: hypothetical protein DDT32_01481 [Syntrophomonadaceae bacterium]|nr:hypothetical protein [Bacillota bacterium]MBT9147716.1 hypothetical protein [Bacillota bacterium]